MTQILLRETCPQLCKQNNDDTREGEQEGGKREERRGEREREREGCSCQTAMLKMNNSLKYI